MPHRHDDTAKGPQSPQIGVEWTLVYYGVWWQLWRKQGVQSGLDTPVMGVLTLLEFMEMASHTLSTSLQEMIFKRN